MNNINTIEKELNAIRVDFYNKTKQMTYAEKAAYLREQTASVNQKYGFTPISRA